MVNRAKDYWRGVDGGPVDSNHGPHTACYIGDMPAGRGACL